MGLDSQEALLAACDHIERAYRTWGNRVEALPQTALARAVWEIVYDDDLSLDMLDAIDTRYNLPAEVFYYVLGRIWQARSRFDHSNETNLIRYMLNGRPGAPTKRHHMMTQSEQSCLEALPDKLKIYRGECEETSRERWSWSLKPEVAEEYARMALYGGTTLPHIFGDKDHGVPGYVLSGQVAKSDVLAYFRQGGKHTIILPPSAVEEVTTYKAADAIDTGPDAEVEETNSDEDFYSEDASRFWGM